MHFKKGVDFIMEWILKGLNYAIKPIHSMKGTRIVGVRWGNVAILFAAILFFSIGAGVVANQVAEAIEVKYDEIVETGKIEAKKQWESQFSIIEAIAHEPSNLYDLQSQYLDGEELNRQMTVAIEENPHIQNQYVPSGAVVKLVVKK